MNSHQQRPPPVQDQQYLNYCLAGFLFLYICGINVHGCTMTCVFSFDNVVSEIPLNQKINKVKNNKVQHVVLMFGPPVSGKGSTAKGIVAGLTAPSHTLEARKMIGFKKREDSGFDAMATALQRRGEYLPDEVMHKQVVEPFFSFPLETQVLILDGLGRTGEQLRLLIAFLKKHNLPQPKGVFFRMQEDDSIRRFEETLSAEDRAGREDAERDTHIKRFRHHQQLEQELVRIMGENGLEHFDVSATRKPLDRVLRICRRFRLPFHKSAVEAYFEEWQQSRPAAA